MKKFLYTLKLIGDQGQVKFAHLLNTINHNYGKDQIIITSSFDKNMAISSLAHNNNIEVNVHSINYSMYINIKNRYFRNILYNKIYIRRDNWNQYLQPFLQPPFANYDNYLNDSDYYNTCFNTTNPPVKIPPPPPPQTLPSPAPAPSPETLKRQGINNSEGSTHVRSEPSERSKKFKGEYPP